MTEKEEILRIFRKLLEEYKRIHASCKSWGPGRVPSHCCFCSPKIDLQNRSILIDCTHGHPQIIETYKKGDIIVYYSRTLGVWNWNPKEILESMGFEKISEKTYEE